MEPLYLAIKTTLDMENSQDHQFNLQISSLFDIYSQIHSLYQLPSTTNIEFFVNDSLE
jgi:hypothetical protein